MISKEVPIVFGTMFFQILYFAVVNVLFGPNQSSADSNILLNAHVIGGKDAYIKDYPFMVSVQFSEMHLCGGSIIRANIVATAAHCFGPDARHYRYYSVLAGSTTLSGCGQRQRAKSVVVHPNFKHLEKNDIALIVLKKKLLFDESVQPIELARLRPPKDSDVVLIGWGVLEEGDTLSSDHLQETKLSILSQKDCIKSFAGIIINGIGPKVICAISKTRRADGCTYDSGGPLVYQGKLVGIVSYGYGCARKGYPGVYSSIPDLYDWIIENLAKRGDIETIN